MLLNFFVNYVINAKYSFSDIFLLEFNPSESEKRFISGFIKNGQKSILFIPLQSEASIRIIESSY